MSERKQGKLKSMDHYQVKWEKSGKLRYGTVQRYGDAAKFNAAAARGRLIITEAVRPVEVLVQESRVTDVSLAMLPRGTGIDLGEWFLGYDELSDYLTLNHIKATIRDLRAPDGLAEGRLFSLGVADGFASYVVTKVGKTTSAYEWRGFNPGGYVDRVLGGGGRVSNAVLRRLVQRQSRPETPTTDAMFCTALKWFGEVYHVDTGRLHIHE